MYHVIIIGVISVILYFLSLTARKFGIITSRAYMAFWNTILLLTFITAAGAGIFLALQSNYQWNIQGVEKILKWHVDFGIAMTFTVIIHLTWNLRYYKIIFKRSPEQNKPPVAGEEKKLPLISFRLMLLLLGFITGAVQVIFLREILNLSGGYEIAAGAVFACWVLVSALGAKLARQSKRSATLTLTAILPVSSIISFLIYITLSKILVEEGVTPGILYTLIITALALIPFCLLSGYLFVNLSYYASMQISLLPGNSFAIETVGSMIAGIMVTLLTGNLLGNFQLILAVIFVYYIIFLLAGKFRFYRLLVIIASLFMVAAIIYEPDTYIRNILLGGVKVVKSIDSRYGNIAISEQKGEKSIFYNHRLIDFEQDQKQREENIHYAMVQHDKPEDILIISGGSDKHIREALKYESVKFITYLERDPELIACTRDTSINYTEAEVLIENDDAFSYIRRINKKHDVIISLLAEPDNIVTNRFYTKEYFTDIKGILNPGGIFMLKTGPSSSYISKEESGSLSTIFNSLNEVFPNVLPIKGESIYLLSSDRSLNTAITDSIREKGIENTYVNSYYLNNEIIKYNSEQVLSVVDSTLPNNLLDKPRAIFYSQRYQLKKAGSNRLPVIIAICLLLLLPFMTGSNSARTMYSASLNLSGTEILALILIQSSAGNFYQLAGLLIATVMAGLAIGSSSRLNIKDLIVDTSPALLGIVAVLYALLSPVILEVRYGSISVLISLVFVLIPAIIAGYYYRRKTEVNIDSSTISGIYFADLCGSALGFLVIAGILVPLYGIKSTFIILAFINFASYITNQVINGIRKLSH
ncbi:MAG: hypothetical protein U9N72_06790 [Bacteroidota bacterium]|nr:hypothetical protein [Bacteroidota bacterium]